ncbi:MAG: esterase/lipase family protein [Sporichthyaceae bacterium]
MKLTSTQPWSRGARLRRGAVATVAAAALLGAALVPGGSASAGTPVPVDTIAGIIAEPALRGANDFGCKPTKDKPRPVVLVHGFGATASENWFSFAPHLAAQGVCVFARTFGLDDRYPGRGAVAPMQESALELRTFVDEVLAATGAAKVDIVGHSHGALMPRHYLKFLGGASKVAHFVGWAGPNHGTSISGLADLRKFFPGFDAQMAQYCGSCGQFLTGSDFTTTLNSGDETPGPTRYTVLVTRYDYLVTPIQTSFLEGARNIVVQDVDPANLADHASMAVNPTVFALTLDALGYPAS